MDVSDQFLLDQFKALRTEIENALTETRRSVMMPILGSGIVWAWILTHPSVICGDSSKSLLLFIPAIMTVLGCVYVLGLNKTVNRIGSHIKEVEAALLKDRAATLGWEHSLRPTNKYVRFPVAIWTMGILAVLFLLNLIVASSFW